MSYVKENLEKLKKSLADADSLIPSIEKVADAIVGCYRKGGKVIVFGNGGSAADAQHMAAELMGWYENKERRGLEAVALTANSSNLTAIGNDKGFDYVFARQVEAAAKKDDVVIGISTSGNSPDVVYGIEKAKEKGAITVALTGSRENKLEKIVDYAIKSPSDETPRIQEIHEFIYHNICGLVERGMFG